MNRYALIDIGSNTTKVLIAEKNELGKQRFLDQHSLSCRLLSEKINESSRISEQSIKHLLDCIAELNEKIADWGVDHIRVVGTEALRKADNSNDIGLHFKKHTGLSLEILSGQQEAEAVAAGLRTDPNLSHIESFLALDLGGGSLELIESTNGETKQAISLPLGAVAIASQSNTSLKSPLPEELLFQLRTYIEAQLHLKASKFSPSPHPLIGCGGTLVFLRSLLGDSNGKDSSKICLSDLEFIMQKMFSLSLEDRIAGFPRLPADRADVFPFGLLSVACAMKFVGHKRLTHSFHNLRHGLIFQQA